ncbi:Imidazolonepropionase [Frankliniella fusca]|uniref:Imidazolonepropionase n=1 Tax=Frankliniella fusca TaxID=407009 RepID=A0AAE1GX10_9NEOP|nr:Imidazolonepropionase [Frankliniella fusca]
MEYADDDMRPPNFFIEENVGAAHNLLDIDQVIDLSPSKRPRLDHTNKVARGPTVRVSHTHILPDTDKGFPKKKKADETLNSQSTDWRNLKPSSAPHQANSDSSMDMFEDGAHQDNVTVVPNENEGSLEKSPSKSLQSQPIISSPEQEQQNLNGSDDEHESVQENNREPLPTASKQTRIMIPKESKRKRSVNTKVWKRNMASQAFNDGLEHVTSKGNLKAARVMGDPCRDNCKRCKGELTHSEREHIFHTFWNLPNINRKRDYISRHIKIRTPDTCHTSPECAKKTSRHYFFAVRGEEILVCKTMFLNTLGVADNWIETSLRKSGGGTLSPDKRGRHRNRPNEASLETVQSVRDHINLFPRIPSHYTRERSKREYLETEVNSIQRMYKLYLEWAKENNITKPASASKYRKIFNTEFNLGFFLPKKDQCEMCNKWKHAENQGERENIVQAYATHLKNKKEVKILKENDVKSASDKKCVACFDLQKVLICPRAETSILFYKNKLSLFNFTVFDTREKEGNCYLWTECDAHKGPNEIGTNLLRFIEKKISEGVEEFSFYSDSPTGQNRNRMIFSLYLCASAKYHVNITHRFLESGHSYTEADSIHARIEEEAKRVQEIFTPDEWITLIKNAKQNGKSYLVSTLKNEEVLDLHYLVDRQNWSGQSKSKIYWSQVREVSVHRDHPNILSYRYNFSDECSTLKVTMKQGQMPDMETFQFPLAYSGRFPLQKNKVNDLKELMKKNTIPSRLHAVFESYLNIAVPDQDDVDD